MINFEFQRRSTAKDATGRSRNQRQDLCATEAPSHGEEKIKWDLYGPPVHGGPVQSRASIFQTCAASRQMRARKTKASGRWSGARPAQADKILMDSTERARYGTRKRERCSKPKRKIHDKERRGPAAASQTTAVR